MQTEVTIIGGGVIGLGIAARLAARVKSLVLFERHDTWGQEISSRNSEVLHSGIYYAHGSLKAAFCAKGQRMLYELAQEAQIPHKRCGKIIIASSESEEADLLRLKGCGERNGAEGLRMLTGAEVAAREPSVKAVAGLLVPDSGIINAHTLMDVLAARAQGSGADLIRGAEVTGLEKTEQGWTVSYRDADGSDTLSSRVVINSAGLGAQALMAMAGIDPEAAGLKLHLAKGEYFTVPSKYRNRLNSMVYPVPHKNLTGLGVHTVPDLSGGFKLGPNAFYVNRIDYTVDEAHTAEFYESARKYLPFLEPDDLVPAMSGIRPKLSAENEPARDFYIRHETERGAPGFFNLAGIESPGLTSCCAIGDYVAEMVCNYL
ncbi:MAG: NAD(P)/FAD-dependent oxidoreductase [Kiritimatiellales bacterium]|jgi:L-2-hydroxyglutarate oxidase LhgO